MYFIQKKSAKDTLFSQNEILLSQPDQTKKEQES